MIHQGIKTDQTRRIESQNIKILERYKFLIKLIQDKTTFTF